MFLDLHAHYPMHVAVQRRGGTHEQLERWRRAWRQALIVRILSRVANYQGPGDEPGVTLDLMQQGDVGVIFSALYCPLDEIDFSKKYGAAPAPGYFQDLLEQLEDVESDVAKHRQAGARATIAHSPAELAEALAAKMQVLIHSVEGGFHLGDSEQEIRDNVATLAKRGVVCITVAHLFWRKIATNAPALPIMSDRTYDHFFPQPRTGLSSLGRATVEAMIENGILIDITHMSQAAIDDTFELVNGHGPGGTIPVIATHAAYRIGGLGYNLSEPTVERIKQTNGVVGLIACEHYISDGAAKPQSFDQSFALLCRHIDCIRTITGSHDHVAFGTDIDGYIKPALPGLEHLGRMRRLQSALEQQYGPEAAQKFSSGNALRVIRDAWR